MTKTNSTLNGIRVVELCQNVAGPYAGLLLGALGADIVKIERPGGGDDTRGWGPPFWGDESVMFATMNAGKSSVILDVDRQPDRQRLLDLVDESDIVLASWRPGSLERRGLGHEVLRKRNERLIYCSISGFGAVGPLAEAPAYDPLIQAFSGIMSMTGESGGGPVRVGTSLIDMGTGMWAALSVLAALRLRDRTGKGSHITSSLFETGLAWIPYQVLGFLATGEVPGRMGSGLPMLVPYQAFMTADEDLVIAAGNDALWCRLCEAIERPDLAQDPNLATNAQRVQQREHVVSELATTLRTRVAQEWSELLTSVGVPASPVQNLSQVWAHPQTKALELFVPTQYGDFEDFHVVGLPFSIDGDRAVPGRPHPALE